MVELEGTNHWGEGDTVVKQSAVSALFETVSERFDRWGPRLWTPLGEITAAYADVRPGQHILDACCGTGASAIPLAHHVGPDGHVTGVDIASRMIKLAERRAAKAGLNNTTFLVENVTNHQDPTEHGYDAVVCGFGIFFLPDMAHGGDYLTRLLRPGGALVVGTWRSGGMDRMVEAARYAAEPFSAVAKQERHTFSEDPRRQVDTATGLTSWLTSRGLCDITVDELLFRQPLTAEAAWSFISSAAPSRFLAGLAPDVLDRVRRRFEELRIQRRLTHLDATTLLGRGVQPGDLS